MKNIKNIMIVGSLVAALCSNATLAEAEAEVEVEVNPYAGFSLGPQFICETQSAVVRPDFYKPTQRTKFVLEYEYKEGEPYKENRRFADLVINGDRASDCELTWGEPWLKESGLNHSFTVDLASIYCRGSEADFRFKTHGGSLNIPGASYSVLYHLTPENEAKGRSIGSFQRLATYYDCNYSGAVLF